MPFQSLLSGAPENYIEGVESGLDASMSLSEIKMAIESAAVPPAIEVVRAKKRILEIVSDGERHETGELLRSLTSLENLESPEVQNQGIAVERLDEISAAVRSEVPPIRRAALTAAAAEAIGELAAQGVIVPLEGHNPPLDLRVGNVRVGGTSGGHFWRPQVPLLAAWYRVPHSLRGSEIWFLDPDLFQDGTEDLGLDPQTQRALRECLEAYRRGLYLASLNLAGAVSEGAWYSAAQMLASQSERLELQDERSAKLQKWVLDRLRNNRETKYVAEELASQAIVFRELRDFGVHPHRPMGDLEKYFNQTECGMLLLTMHRYLVRLSEACSSVQRGGE